MIFETPLRSSSGIICTIKGVFFLLSIFSLEGLEKILNVRLRTLLQRSMKIELFKEFDYIIDIDFAEINIGMWKFVHKTHLGHLSKKSIFTSFDLLKARQ